MFIWKKNVIIYKILIILQFYSEYFLAQARLLPIEFFTADNLR